MGGRRWVLAAPHTAATPRRLHWGRPGAPWGPAVALQPSLGCVRAGAGPGRLGRGVTEMPPGFLHPVSSRFPASLLPCLVWVFQN